MTPSPEAGELTPERLAELTRVVVCAVEHTEHTDGDTWIAQYEFALVVTPPRVLALISTLQATQARLEESRQESFGRLLSWNEANKRIRTELSRAELAEQERDNAINQQGLADDLMNKAYRAAELAERELSLLKAFMSQSVVVPEEEYTELCKAADVNGGASYVQQLKVTQVNAIRQMTAAKERAALAEQEASRWKADAEKAVEALTNAMSDMAKSYGLGTPESRAVVTAIEHARTPVPNRALTSIRGDAT